MLTLSADQLADIVQERELSEFVMPAPPVTYGAYQPVPLSLGPICDKCWMITGDVMPSIECYCTMDIRP